MARPPTVSFAALVSVVTLSACDAPSSDARGAYVADALLRANDAMVRARPVLVEGMFSTMSEPGISFYRGSLGVYRADWADANATGIARSRFALAVPLVPSIGDAHPENFGTLLAPDGTIGVEPNDFDAADRAPYLWDVRRLAAGMALAAHLANPDDVTANGATSAAALDTARAVAAGYAAGIESAAHGATPGRVVAPTGNAFLDDLLSRSARDAADRAELSEMTVFDAGGARHLIRGAIDPTDPQNILASLPDFAVASLPATLATYRGTLLAPPPPEYFTVLDAAREFGAGVSSWPKLRAIVLLRGPTDATDDDVLVEVKEIEDSGIAGLYPPGVYADDVEARVRLFSRAEWSRPDADPLWGTSTWEGFHVQVRSERESNKGVKVAKMTGDLGTVPVLTDLAARLGTLLARIHATSILGSPSAAPDIWATIAVDEGGFADEQAAIGASYALQSLADGAGFQRSLATLGPLLGFTVDPVDAPTPDLAALLGTPPPPLPPTAPSPSSAPAPASSSDPTP